jgi:hypothetical protein
MEELPKYEQEVVVAIRDPILGLPWSERRVEEGEELTYRGLGKTIRIRDYSNREGARVTVNETWLLPTLMNLVLYGHWIPEDRVSLSTTVDVGNVITEGRGLLGRVEVRGRFKSEGCCEWE